MRLSWMMVRHARRSLRKCEGEKASWKSEPDSDRLVQTGANEWALTFQSRALARLGLTWRDEGAYSHQYGQLAGQQGTHLGVIS